MASEPSSTLFETWLAHAHARPNDQAVVHWVAGEDPHRWTWAALLRQAMRYAQALHEAGVRAGDVCATVLRHHKEFYPLYMGIEAVGALPAVLAYPNPRLHPDKFRQGLSGMARRSGLKWVLTERELEPNVRPLVSAHDSTVRDILFPLEWHLDELPPLEQPHAAPADDPCLLQHSSGTTGLQKAVTLSHRAVLTHVRNYGKAIALSARDKVVSWLPLYHDMGLIAAFHVPLAFGITTIQLDPFEWVLAPSILLEAIGKEMATLAWLPNFAYSFMADRIHDEDLEGVRLESVRMLINCSEPVRFASHEKFAARFGSLGLNRAALTACYAMAETTFAVTQTAPGQEARSIPASRPALSSGRYAPPAQGEASMRCVSSGRPIDGCELRIVDEQGAEVGNGVVGEIVIRSQSMFDGYRHNPETTAQVLKDGWYWSGDYGFRLGGEYFIIGRKKDIIIVAGKNLYPEDIEDVISSVPGVLPGRVIAFGAEDEAAGTEQICIVAETTAAAPQERKALRLAILEMGMKNDYTIARTYLVPPRWLIKSSSGKPSRSANRQRALDELTPE